MGARKAENVLEVSQIQSPYFSDFWVRGKIKEKDAQLRKKQLTSRRNLLYPGEVERTERKIDR